jgi:hypothetical protein
MMTMKYRNTPIYLQALRTRAEDKISPMANGNKGLSKEHLRILSWNVGKDSFIPQVTRSNEINAMESRESGSRFVEVSDRKQPCLTLHRSLWDLRS